MAGRGRPKGSLDKVPRKAKNSHKKTGRRQTKSHKKTGRRQAAEPIPWEEAKRVLNQLYKDEDYVYAMIFVIGLYFGLRISEIRKVKWDDLINGETLNIQEEKTGRMRGDMPINKQIRNLAYQVYNRLQPTDEHVVPWSWHRQTVLWNFKRIKRKYGIQVEHFSTHSLRKTFGRRYMEKNNFSAKALILLNEAFGHRNLRETKKYLGFTKDETMKIYEQICDEPILF